MLNKIFIAVLAIAALIMLFFTIYSYSWLQSIGSPEIAISNFSFYSGIAWNFLWLSFVALVIFSAALIWKKGRSWSLWGAYAYFAAFVTLQTFWLSTAQQSFMETNNLVENSYSFDPVFGAVIIVVIAIATFFTRFILLQVRDKIKGNQDKEIAVDSPSK